MKPYIIFILFISFFCGITKAQSPQFVIQRGHIAPITDAIFSAKQNLLITTSFDKSIKVWQAQSGKELRTFPNVMQGFSQIRLALLPDGQSFIALTGNSELTLFDAINSTKNIIQENNSNKITQIQAHPTQPHLAIGYQDGHLEIINYKNQTSVQSWHIGEEEIAKIQYSTNGQYLMARSKDQQFFAWDIKKSKHLTHLPKQAVSFHINPNNQKIALLENDSSLVILKIKNGKKLQQKALNSSFRLVRFAEQERILLMNKAFQLEELHPKTLKIAPLPFTLPRFYTFKIFDNGQIFYNQGPAAKILNLQNWQQPKTYTGYVGNVYTSNINSVIFDKKSRNIITGGGQETIRFWGESNQEQIEVGFEINHLELSENGQLLLCSGESKKFHLIDIQQQKIIQTFEGHKKGVMKTAFWGDDKIISVSKDKTARVWQINDPKEKIQLTAHKKFVYSVATHQKHFATGDANGNIFIWKELNTQPLQSFVSDNATVNSLLFSADGKQLYVGRDDGFIEIWDWASAKIIHKFQPYKTAITSLTLKNDQLFVASFISENDQNAVISVFNNNYKLQHIFGGHQGGVTGFSISENGKYLVSTGNDNFIKLWQINNQILQATQYSLGQGDWAWLSPNGLFDASNDAMNLMHYTYKDEPIQLQQLKERYYEPDLLQKLLGYNDEPLRNPTVFKTVELYPAAKLSLSNGLTMSVNLTARNGGIGKVSVFINQKEIIEDANPTRKKTLKINLLPYRKYLLNDTTNQISIQVYNKKGWLHSDFIAIDYLNKISARGTNTDKKKLSIRRKPQPKFYALVIGTSNYRGETLDLSYADKDAKDIANALRLTSDELFGEANTEIVLLNTEQNSSLQPSKTNIQNAFAEMAQKATANDVFVLYLSGHGVNYGAANSQFYYLTKEIASEDLGDQTIRDNYTISSQEFTQFLKSIPANKQIMILDACSSGSLVENLLSQSRSLSSSQKRALDRMKDRTGVFILAGSAANKVSYEASQFGQGLLTYSLLSGMQGGALRENEFIDVMQLFQYAADKVPELAAVVGGVQRPVIASPSSTSSFDFGQVTDSIRYKIPLEEVKPLFIKSNFQHETLYEDVLDLGDQLDKTFTTIGDDADANILFINVKKYPKAYSIKGRYKIDTNGMILLSAKLLKDKAVIGDIELSSQNVENLIEEVLNQVVELQSKESQNE